MMFNNPRTRALLGAGTALVVVAGIGIGVATSSAAASQRYVTALASTGDVTQTYTATGAITREGTVQAAFTVDGTVRRVDVAVGDEVEAGDTLAVLGRADLQLAVLEAETSVARAKASLYSAQHPGSSSSVGTVSGSGSAGSGRGGTGVSVDPKLLAEATSRVNLAVLAEADACTAIFDAILPEAEPTAEPTATSSAEPTAEPTATGSADPTDATTEASASATATPTGSATASAEPEPSSSPTADPATEAEPEPTASASQLAAVGDSDFTDEQLQTCANARAEVLTANDGLQAFVLALTQAGGAPAPSGSSQGSSSTSVSASEVASAKADLLQAEQELAAAQEDLDAAVLVAPISGTVGTVGMTKGDSASAGTITIVGTGSAVVTMELPLKTRQLVGVGQEVTVTPAGSTTTLTGRITAIASLATDGTSGDTATYTTTVSVSDADGLLASGANASVLIPVLAETGVLRVPASAVTPTGTGTATVQVVESAGSDTASSVPVETGAVGGGWVQITSGLQAGQLVVLADTTADIPSNTSNRRLTSGSTAAR